MRIFSDSLDGFSIILEGKESLSLFEVAKCYTKGYYPTDCHLYRPSGCPYLNVLDKPLPIKKNFLFEKSLYGSNYLECPVPSSKPMLSSQVYIEEYKFSINLITTKVKYSGTFSNPYENCNDTEFENYDNYYLNICQGDDFRLILKYENSEFPEYSRILFIYCDGSIILDVNSEMNEFFLFSALVDSSLATNGKIVRNQSGQFYHKQYVEEIISIKKIDKHSIQNYIIVEAQYSGEKQYSIY